MCTSEPSTVSSIVTTAVQFGRQLRLRHILVAPAAVAWGVAMWIWPVTVFVVTGVFGIACGMAYALGAARARPYTVINRPQQPQTETATVVELERRRQEAEQVADAARRKLEAARQQPQQEAQVPYRVLRGVPADRQLDA